MPGRFFMQRFIRSAVKARCDFVILEMTSQGAAQGRHQFIDLDTLAITNISPEHIEAHGSYENYVNAKLSIAKDCIAKSNKEIRTIIAKAGDKESPKFLEVDADRKITYSIEDIAPYSIKKEGVDINIGSHETHSPLSGLFNIENIALSIAIARHHGVSDEIISRAISKFNGVRGRVEKIEVSDKQDFTVIVDYAHTTDSLEKLYQVFENSRNICVLGGTGGGRDTWKRTEMGKIAHAYCDDVILTDEDPYDEDPKKIVDDVARGVRESGGEPTIIMDRRLAIREAVARANKGDTVLITGKGTDPYIMGPNGTKTPWSDAEVAKEELNTILKSR
jgi:UDP-N-acetylmuramoyl-L-alanyl-D-glutamate--2,6-diaminopimelate ligase